MEFGLFFLMQRDERWSEQAVYDSGLEQMLAAEALGYRSVWIAEHHFNDYGLCPTPPVLASFVAARTRAGMPIVAASAALAFSKEQLLAVQKIARGRDRNLVRGPTIEEFVHGAKHRSAPSLIERGRVAAVLEEMVTGFGHHTSVAHNGAQAIRAVREIPCVPGVSRRAG